MPITEDPLAWLHAMWVPCLIAGAPLGAACARMSAASLRTVLGEDALRTARGKGVREGRVMRHHALPLAAPPVIALVAVNTNLLITNVALMETVFNIPGSLPLRRGRACATATSTSPRRSWWRARC